jgi:putative transcriptional regulator
MVFLGYSGWGPGQLEGEIAGGSWLPTPFDETVLFDVSNERKWESAHALIGVSPAMGIGMRIIGDA